MALEFRLLAHYPLYDRLAWVGDILSLGYVLHSNIIIYLSAALTPTRYLRSSHRVLHFLPP